jgi:uncharacterized protein (DUF2062 family)
MTHPSPSLPLFQAGNPTESNKLSIIGSIIGAAAGGASFLLILLLAGLYAYHQKKRRERASKHKNHFGTLRF